MSQKTSLEKEKYSLTEGLDEDPELKKHVQELEACHNSSSERLYHQLREELETLQQECYTRQMKYGHQQQDKAVASSAKPSWSHVKPSPFHPKNDMTFKVKTQRQQQQQPIIDLTRENEEEEKGESGNESDWEPLDESELASIDIMEAMYNLEEEEIGIQEKLLDPFDDDFDKNDFDTLPLLPPPALRQNASLAAKNITTNYQASSSLASGISKSYSCSSLSNAKAPGSQDREGLL
uniref:Uncharacterized protein n=1 Tax=Amphimedon queenslandica TaxID=400682 RepID=A0A1X7TDF6_AMPQE